MQNQSVSRRLRSHLDVQFAHSNVIQDECNPYFESRIICEKNSSDSCDLSLIDDLKLLDQFEELEPQNTSQSYITQSLIDGMMNNRQQQYNHEDTEINNNKLSFPSNLKERINLLYSQEPRFNHYVQDQEMKISEFLMPTLRNQLPSRHINRLNIQTNKKTVNMDIENCKMDKPSSVFEDIEEKISILPLELRQKIRQNIQKKISQKQSHGRIKNYQVKNCQQSSINNEICHQQSVANEVVSFILPLKEDDEDHFKKRSKFVSVNRESSLNRNQKSLKKSMILKEDNYECKSKNSKLMIERRRQQFAQFEKQKSSSTNNNKQNYFLQQKEPDEINQKQNVKIEQNVNFNILRQNLHELSEQFNKSKVIRNYTEILSTVPKCRKCSKTYGALTLANNNSVTFSCNQCDLKNKLERSVSFLSSSDRGNSQNDFFMNLDKTSSQYNHPVIGVLFDLQNKLENDQQMKTYNALLKQISKEIQTIDQMRQKLTLLLGEIEQLKAKVQKNPKVIFEAKNQLKKFLINNEHQESKELQNFLKISVANILPSQYLQELDLWCKINTKRFTDYPLIESKLQMLCPLYMKRYIKTMGEFLNPLFHNFETMNMRISISQGLKLPVKSLGQATFVIDGPYNISPFQQIQNLTLEFVNKRTFREIASVMQSLPQKVESIQLSYNHKFNSHISAEKYPILTKIASLRSCKKLKAQILNCKDQDDLLSTFRVMTKKRQLRLYTTRSIYVRKPFTNCTQELKEMLKRLGKNICQIELKLAANFDESQIYKELMVTERNKLILFKLQSTVNQIESPVKLEKSHQKLLKSDNLSNNQSRKNNSKEKIQNFAKKKFFDKIRKKLTAFAVLKQSYIEKESLESLNEQQIKFDDKETYKQHFKSNHILRIEILKMLI